MSHIITSVDDRSPAARAGVRAGDRLVRVNGEIVIDFLDYQALTAERKLKLTLLRGGRETEISVSKGEYEELGLNFEKPMMSGVRMCCNKCLFCFVDQLPPHVRESMRVKDDDWRMSLMMGSYVTLTNVSDRELERIIARHASPLYISVHATEPELREKLLGTPRAKKLMEQLKKLSDGGIEFHCQAVLCPGLNDGEALEQTIRELTQLSGALSLALVPVGLTNHREGLAELRKYNADEEYEDYGQIDDGVGLLRLLHTEYVEAWSELPEEERAFTGGRKIAIACGVSAAEFLARLLKEHPVSGMDVTVYPVENGFFGSNVTVSGLVTGGDLLRRMKGVDCEKVLVTGCMLRNEGDRFLDDRLLEDVCAELGRPVVPVGRRGDELLDALLECR